MRHALTLAALTTLAACASTHAPLDAEKPHQTVAFYDPSMQTMFTDHGHAVAAKIAKPQVAVWAAVKKAYAELEIPVATEDAKAH